MYQATTLHGAGIGLRSQHYRYILEQRPHVHWFEALVDNYMGAGGLPLYYLEQIAQAYPLSFHGVGLSLASEDAVNMVYLRKLKNLVDRFQPALVSDHLAWASNRGRYLHELMPFPYTRNNLHLVADKINRVQDFIGRQLLVENPSLYLSFNLTQMPEWDFINLLVERTGCGLLLDVNNLYVSAFNTGFSAMHYLHNLTPSAVQEMHLAGYEDRDTHLYDTHGYPVRQPVWSLYEMALCIFPDTPTLIEWDTDIPAFETLQHQAATAQAYLDHRMFGGALA